MKYSDRAGNRCFAEAPLPARFSLGVGFREHLRCCCVRWAVSACSRKSGGRPAVGTRGLARSLWPFPAQGSPQSLFGRSSHHVLLFRFPPSAADVGFLATGSFCSEKDSPRSCMSNGEHKLFEALVPFQKICSENVSYVQRKMCAPSCDAKELILLFLDKHLSKCFPPMKIRSIFNFLSIFHREIYSVHKS